MCVACDFEVRNPGQRDIQNRVRIGAACLMVCVNYRFFQSHGLILDIVG